MMESECLKCRREYHAGDRDQRDIRAEVFETEQGDDGELKCIRTCSDGHRIEDEFKPLI